MTKEPIVTYHDGQWTVMVRGGEFPLEVVYQGEQPPTERTLREKIIDENLIRQILQRVDQKLGPKLDDLDRPLPKTGEGIYGR